MLTVSKDKTTYLEVTKMKTKFLSFVAGALSVLMLVALPISALASDGALSIKAYPIYEFSNFSPASVWIK